jgi:hypothetical protein
MEAMNSIPTCSGKPDIYAVAPRNDEALSLLDEFLGQHSERTVRDLLKRAVFQRDLLAIYDWLSSPFAFCRTNSGSLRFAEVGF